MTNDITIIKSGHQSEAKGIEVCLKEDIIREQAKNARELFSSIQSELDDLDDLKDGLSYLDMKNDTLLSYMIDLCNIFLKKVRGEAISDHPSIERTVYYRVILEKIKAIDQRLAYQLNKVITMPDDAGQAVQGVNINNLDVDLGSDNDRDEEELQASMGAVRDSDDDDDDDDEDDDEGDDEDPDDDCSVDSVSSEKEDDDSEIDSEIEDEPKVKKVVKNPKTGTSKKPTAIYKPPKLRSVAYDDGREEGRVRRRRDYNEFYQDDDDNHDIVEETRAANDHERTRYEEENYTRLRDVNPKKAKRKAKQVKSKGKKKFKGGGGGKRR